MLKVKIIADDSKYGLEEKINEFIKDKKVINISYTIAGCGYGYTHECCILYEV